MRDMTVTHKPAIANGVQRRQAVVSWKQEGQNEGGKLDWRNISEPSLCATLFKLSSIHLKLILQISNLEGIKYIRSTQNYLFHHSVKYCL